jgi:hypothetical protein
MIQRLLILSVSLVVVLSACSEQAMTFPEYAPAIQEVTDAYIAEAQALAVTFYSTVEAEVTRIVEEGSDDAHSEATDVTKREMVLYLALLEDTMNRYMERLAEIRPPTDVSEQHSDYVDAIESVRGAMPSTRSSVASALHLDGIEAAVAGSGFQDGQFRLTTTCQSLEESVRAAGVGIDLGCTRLPTDDG